MAKTTAVMMNSDSIYIIRYVIIPSAGFFLGAFLFLLICRNYFNRFFEGLEVYVKRYSNKVFLSIIVIYSLFFLSTITLRYFSSHVGLFDFGIYDWRIWQIHVISWSDWPEKFKSSLRGHFQPILAVYSTLYDLNIEPVILNILQAITVLSGIIPLYLIARDRFKTQLLALSISFLYLLYPATQFNIAIDFHPDHLIIPIFFWSYYLIERGAYIWLLPLVFIGYTLKESLVPAIAFMGLYIAWEKKNYTFGFILFLVSLMVFYLVTFIVVPSITKFQPHEGILESNTFSYLFESKEVMPILKEIFHFEKWRFPFFMLFPLLFLPILKFKVLLPAIPLIAIPILSTIIHHQDVASQYTAGIIPPVVVSFTYAIAYLHDRFGNRVTLAILSWVGMMILAFNIAHSPSPVAVAFWNKDWSGGRWHYTNYIKDNHDVILGDAIKLIPADPSVKVVTHSRIYNKRLARRYFYSPFPLKWQEANYVLLDNRKGRYVIDNLDEDLYYKELSKLVKSKDFKLIYDRDGVLVFRKDVK